MVAPSNLRDRLLPYNSFQAEVALQVGLIQVLGLTAMSTPDWKKLEHLAAEIQQSLSPASTILHNVKVPGRSSGTDRQIDVLIRDQVGQFPIQIAIECKDHGTPADVNVVGEFQSLLQDARISKGVLVCPGGFTRPALQLAASNGIETYRPVDTNPHKWRCSVSLPTICDYRSVQISLRLSFSLPLPLKIPYNTGAVALLDNGGVAIGTIAEVAARNWDLGRFPMEPGEHEVPVCVDDMARIDNGYGQVVPIELMALLRVSRRRFFGQMPIAKVRGFQDVQTGHLITNAFELGALDPNEVESNWPELGDGEPPTPAALMVRGLYCMGVGDS
ncbi:restriction endonuclease [Xanthomonas campestris]|uniref:restriction endonuclease n=1 Tax=Xanthomonas campestris TaxID=339 RepID=UPI000E1EEFA7|nr:restriction endonuclease [Xanthomonas campestris]